MDTFSLLKELPNNKKVLGPFKRNDFAEIYLFFDYDGHTSSANDEKMKAIIELFDEETEFGKIFINYPMVESLKHITDNMDAFRVLKVEAKKNINYKRIARNECQSRFRDFNLYTKEIWIFLIKEHLKKMNFIIKGNYILPTKTQDQNKIFSNQLEKYINVDSIIAVLSSFPIFIFDYYGAGLISEAVTEQ